MFNFVTCVEKLSGVLLSLLNKIEVKIDKLFGTCALA